MYFFRSILPIHPSFRVLALAEPPVAGASKDSSSSRGQQWLSPELLTMFLYHTVTRLAKAEEMGLIQGLVRHTLKDNTSIHASIQTCFLCSGCFFVNSAVTSRSAIKVIYRSAQNEIVTSVELTIRQKLVPCTVYRNPS